MLNQIILIISCFFGSLTSLAQNKYPEFILAFGNDFDKDSVTIIINQKKVADNIPLNRTMIDPQNLMIEQKNSTLEVRPHNQPRVKLNRVQVKDSILHLDIRLNGKGYNFNCDLRKGSALIAEYRYIRMGWNLRKYLTIYQTNVILMF